MNEISTISTLESYFLPPSLVFEDFGWQKGFGSFGWVWKRVLAVLVEYESHLTAWPSLRYSRGIQTPPKPKLQKTPRKSSGFWSFRSPMMTSSRMLVENMVTSWSYHQKSRPIFFFDLAKSKLKVFDSGHLGQRFSSYFPVKRPARSPKLYGLSILDWHYNLIYSNCRTTAQLLWCSSYCSLMFSAYVWWHSDGCQELWG